MNTRLRTTTAVLSLCAMIGLTSSVTRAQTAPNTAPGTSPQASSSTNTATATPNSSAPTGTTIMERFEVTGSYLPPAANAVAIPVISVDANQIENAGPRNVLE